MAGALSIVPPMQSPGGARGGKVSPFPPPTPGRSPYFQPPGAGLSLPATAIDGAPSILPPIKSPGAPSVRKIGPLAPPRANWRVPRASVPSPQGPRPPVNWQIPQSPPIRQPWKPPASIAPLPRCRMLTRSFPWPMNQLASRVAAQTRARGPPSGFPPPSARHCRNK